MDQLDVFKTLLAAMTPIGELRLSIPLAIYTLNMHWFPALVISLVGNIIPVIVLTLLLNRFGRFITSFPNPLGKLLIWRSTRITTRSSDFFTRYRLFALLLMVAIPLPFTGAWTAILAAWVFAIPARVSIPVIALGILISGAIVTLLTEMGIHIAILMLD